MVKVEVAEKKRKVVFASGMVKYFNNVTAFDKDGEFLRIWCDEGYVLINEANINYIVVPSDAEVQ